VQIVTCTGSEFVLLASDLTALDNRSIPHLVDSDKQCRCNGYPIALRDDWLRDLEKGGHLDPRPPAR
jgi:hypothetical protein